jgi:sulfite reductase (NADPH) flavoprotein alpha-component
MLGALNPDNSPFDEQQLELLKRGIDSLDTAQAQWLSGYLAGRAATAGADTPPAEARTAPARPLAILYGSETGNGEGLAGQLADAAHQAGLDARLVSLDDFRPVLLGKLAHAVFIISTHGEGDPPEEAAELFEYLGGTRAPKLDGLRYRVLALGDRSYEHFCAAGRALDERLAELGAERFGPRIECDVDYAGKAQSFSDEVLAWAREHLVRHAATPAPAHLRVVPDTERWSRRNPFRAEVLGTRPITADGSPKEVHHIELALEGSGLRYQPGDALGVWAPNEPGLVGEVLERLGIDPSSEVTLAETSMPVSEALTGHLEITRLTSDTVQAYAAATGREGLQEHFSGLARERQQDFIRQRQFADLVDAYPATLDAGALAALLRPLGARSYSIASSGRLVGEEAHLTVATLRSNAIGIDRLGVASQYLNGRLRCGDAVRVFLEPNRRFRLPEDRAAPLILIGAGTGIAPYRAFLQDLEATGDSPRAWLIFGNPHLRTDFLYQREFLKWRERGLLDRIDAAWSRDQAAKRYVQDVVADQAERIDRWLEAGAHVYVCGGLAMGRAVQEGLQQALGRARGLAAGPAGEALAALRREGRFHKDLY